MESIKEIEKAIERMQGRLAMADTSPLERGDLFAIGKLLTCAEELKAIKARMAEVTVRKGVKV